MWIVRLALRRPYTSIVMSLLILILGVVSIFRTPVDIFPVVDSPVVSVIVGEGVNDGRKISEPDGSTLCRPCAFGAY